MGSAYECLSGPLMDVYNDGASSVLRHGNGSLHGLGNADGAPLLAASWIASFGASQAARFLTS